MRCPPINLGSEVVIHNKRSMRHYSSSTDKNKSNLRKKIINLRKSFHKNDSECGEAISINLIKYLINNKLIKKNLKIALYWPMGSEISTKQSIAALNQFTEKILIASTENKNIKFRIWKPNTNITPYNLGFIINTKEYKNPDIIVCPLIAFDNKCNRLGRGGGFYDKVLNNYKTTRKIGFAYSIQNLNDIPTENHDIKMDAIITEKYIIEN